MIRSILQDAQYKKIKLDNMCKLNSLIHRDFSKLGQEEIGRKSHYFNGRYENLYVDEKKLPILEKLMLRLKDPISELTGIAAQDLKIGYWFNAMASGQVTTLHCHDEQDEILSGVYYINVPPESGNLVLHADKIVEIVPEEGTLIVFKPDLDHEVTENRSEELRLSVGFNVFEIGR